MVLGMSKTELHQKRASNESCSQISNLTIASDAKNSLIEDRKTARPSAPRQKGVCPAPFN